jgi:hypothetical protein
MKRTLAFLEYLRDEVRILSFRRHANQPRQCLPVPRMRAASARARIATGCLGDVVNKLIGLHIEGVG